MFLERWDNNLVVIGVALVIAVRAPRCKFSQVAHTPIASQQNAQKDCGRGVLPFTKTNLMCPFPAQFLAPGLVSRAGNKENSR
jgi:hypothetical protein